MKTQPPRHDAKIQFVKFWIVKTNAPRLQERILNLSYWKPNSMRVDFFDRLFFIWVIVSFQMMLFPSDQINLHHWWHDLISLLRCPRNMEPFIFFLPVASCCVSLCTLLLYHDLSCVVWFISICPTVKCGGKKHLANANYANMKRYVWAIEFVIGCCQIVLPRQQIGMLNIFLGTGSLVSKVGVLFCSANKNNEIASDTC